MDKLTASLINSLINKFNSLNSPSFVGLTNYKNDNGQIADYQILVNFEYYKAKLRDAKILSNLLESDFIKAKKNWIEKYPESRYKLDIELLKQATEKEFISLTNNSNKKTKTNASKGQEEAYVHITPCMKLHIETKKLFIFAFEISKTIKVAGTYIERDSEAITVARNYIKKFFNLSTAKYRNFSVENQNLEKINIDHATFDFYNKECFIN
jgi:hypothetical protein